MNFEEAREALEQLYGSSNEKRRFILRLYVLYSFNDKYGIEGLKYLYDCEDYLYFVENCREMIKMSQTNPTLRAELYREIGEFEQMGFLKKLELKTQTIPNHGKFVVCPTMRTIYRDVDGA